jgi:RimJ/RimL family protein N-acetyltransferase
LATAALRALAEHAFATTELTRLFALPFADNAASRRVLEKAGFVLDAILRKSAIKRGRVVDQALYSRVRE